MAFRETYIDAVAGLMIIWMMIGHVQQIAGYSFNYPDVLFFFMPWFYYKSGMLSKAVPFKQQLEKGGEKFAKPFVVFGLLGQLVLILCMLLEHTNCAKPYVYSPIRALLLGGTWSGNPPLWFLTSLFVTQCVYAWFVEKKVNIVIVVFISLILALLINKINSIYFPIYISSGLYGLFFYSMGKILYRYQGNAVLFVVSVSMFVLLFLWLGFPSMMNLRFVSSCGGTFVDFFSWTLMALCGCIFVTYIFKQIHPILQFPLMQYIGRNAMDFYVLHWIVMLFAMRLVMGDFFGISSPVARIIVGILCCTVFIPIFIFCKNKTLGR